ncbi:MAG: ATP-binding protein [Chloroflexi bacterium]|nr:ATP-binding protein [Chloroflexota bacterium]
MAQRQNPYCYTQPIENTGLFVGRSAQIVRCCELIDKEACLSFVGGPSSGLTSLLKRALAPDICQSCAEPAESLRFVYLDCSSFPDPLDLVRRLLQELAPDQAPPRVPRWQPAFGQLIRAMEALRAKGTRAVLLLDDFEEIGANEKYIEFLDRFRGLTNHARMSLITATHTQLKSCCHMSIAESPFPNMFSVEYVGAFTEQEAQEFIAATSAMSGLDLTPYAEEIFALSGRMPYLMQMACWRYYQLLAERQRPDYQDVEAFIVQEAASTFDRVWAGLTDEERQVLSGLSKGEAVPTAKSELVAKGYVAGERICSSALARYVARLG